MSRNGENYTCELNDGEQILWEGETKPFRITEGTDGQEILLIWGLCLLLPAFSALLSLFGNTIHPIIAVILLGLASWLSLSPVITYNRLRKQRYLITNERAVLIMSNGENRSIELNLVKSFYTFGYGSESGSLVLETQHCEIESRQLRERSVQPVMAMDGDGAFRVGELVFYHVGNVNKAAEVLNTITRRY